MSSIEHVVLVNARDQVVGTLPKREVHTANTPLHRGFSLFLFRPDGKFLIQQRAKQKVTWPGVWSNSCCGHPAPGETYPQAATRRLIDELGLAVQGIEMLLPYRYRFTRDGVVENEICPILVGVTDQKVKPNRNEVESIRWVAWAEFVERAQAEDSDLSPWCQEETDRLVDSERFAAWCEARSLNLGG